MSHLHLATTPEDAHAVDAVVAHHTEMAGALQLKVTALRGSARADGDVWPAPRDDLVGWCHRELVPHALAEEKTLYPAAAAKVEGRLLVEGMLAEHVLIKRLVGDLAGASDGVGAAAAATALLEVFESHLAKENDLVLPLLAADPDVSVAGLLIGMHEVLGGDASRDHIHEPAGSAPEAGDHSCGCHEAEDSEWPELDARAVPHAIRHATIFGAFDAVPVGSAMVLVAPHDPLPLLAQLDERTGGGMEFEYTERGPEAWRIVLHRCR